MDVTVRLFAAFADALGATETTVSVAEPVTVGAFRIAMARLAPRLPPRPLVAINAEYADDDQIIAPGDEVAVIAPVAGG